MCGDLVQGKVVSDHGRGVRSSSTTEVCAEEISPFVRLLDRSHQNARFCRPNIPSGTTFSLRHVVADDFRDAMSTMACLRLNDNVHSGRLAMGQDFRCACALWCLTSRLRWGDKHGVLTRDLREGQALATKDINLTVIIVQISWSWP